MECFIDYGTYMYEIMPAPIQDYGRGFQFSGFYPDIAIRYTNSPFDHCLDFISPVILLQSFIQYLQQILLVMES